MDLKQLNVLLLPFNIEIICEGCSSVSEAARQHHYPLLNPTNLPSIPLPPKKPLVTDSAKSNRKKLISKHRATVHNSLVKENPYANNQQSHSRRPFHSPKNYASDCKNPQISHHYPPNQFLNLNTSGNHNSARQKELFALMEDSMKTPNKIGDVDVDYLMLSDRKRFHPRHLFSESTADGGVFDLNNTPVKRKTPRDDPEKTRFHEQIALSGAPSRVASPCYSPIKYQLATPVSRIHKSPESGLSVSPLPNGNGGHEVVRKKNADFPMNLFYDTL